MERTQSAVVLPCSTKEFGDFISTLLGKPQSISNTFKGPFEINRNSVNDIYSLLTQRVEQQNDGVLTQFTAKLVYDDDSSVLLNSIDDYMVYNEVRPVACRALHLSWTFLVKFNGKEHPEKQQIDLSFLSGFESPLFDIDTSPMRSSIFDTGFISYSISHTARSWGSDIDALIGSHIKGIVEEVPKIKKWISKNDSKISLIVFCLIFAASVTTVLATTALFLKKQREATAPFYSPTNADSPSPEALNYILETVASGTWERFLLVSVVFTLLSFVASIAVSIWVAATANNTPPSFLLLTKESEKKKKRILARRKKKWYSFLASISASVLLGVAGNICYGLFFENLIKP